MLYEVITKRQVMPDPKYNDVLAGRFINAILEGGKKSLAERIFYDALDRVGEKSKEDLV